MPTAVCHDRIRRPACHIVQQTIERFKAKPDQVEAVIARALEPVHATDGKIEWLPGCDPTPHSPTAGSVNPSKIDYYNQTNYISVTANTHVATIQPPVPGTDGQDVTGKPRKAKSGSIYQLKTDSSASVDEAAKFT